MFIRQDVPITNTLQSRDEKSSNPPMYKASIAIAIIVGCLCALGFAWLAYRRWRQTRTAKYSRSGRDDNHHTETTDGPATTEMTISEGHSRLNNQNNNNVDRNTSVRSVMTLPPYRHKPLENESVLGREGERDGIDIVIEMPTVEDEEALREGEMDALYQIRVARRRQIEEQEALRAARSQARTQNDQVALSRIREQTRAAATSNTQEIESLRRDHNRARESRARAVGSVSYAELGVARHDGTRIRANSSESERIGLLSDVANIGMSGAAARPSSDLQPSSQRPSLHQRGHSGNSVLSVETAHSGDEPRDARIHLPSAQTSTRSRASSIDRAGSSPELIDAAEDGEDLPSRSPPRSPPSYDDVSLSSLTPAQTHSENPYIEPPPEYTLESTDTRSRRGSSHSTVPSVEAAAAAMSSPAETSTPTQGISLTGDISANQLPHNSNTVPQVPNLRIDPPPQIAIEPPSAAPREPEQ
ncbi:hypothetical protein SEPCBS119000_005914 [Sporothrix epigloea]|uniref:Uncharacterized protein n=1 Tax=Sporothrix epigloea TaxID=1892477 RepID=A0ABP0E053_9PEZI